MRCRRRGAEPFRHLCGGKRTDRGEFARLTQGRCKQAEILIARNFTNAELFQVGCVPLRIDEGISCIAQQADKGGQGDFGGIRLAMEHGFAEKYAAQCDSVESAGQASVFPRFHGVGMAEAVEFFIAGEDAVVDPCFRTRGTLPHHFGKTGVDADFPSGFSQRAAESVGTVEFLEKKDAAWIGREPQDAGLVGHGEVPVGVST